MIWYLHWLQMRRNAMLVVPFLLVGGIIFGLALRRQASSTPWNDSQIAAHAAAVPMATLIATLALAGNGLKERRSAAHAVPYVLTLPISRANVISTRLSAGILGLAMMLGLLFSINASVLSAVGRPIPWTIMAEISSLSFAFAVPAMIATTLIHSYLDARGAAVVILVMLALSSRWVNRSGGGSWSPLDAPWQVAGYSLLATALLFALTIYLGQRKEF